MRPIRLHVLSLLALVTLYLCLTHGKQIPQEVSSLARQSENTIDYLNLQREKRQLENFDSGEYPTAQSQDSQEEPGFWDRVVKVALKLFSKFVEWLNS